MNEYDLVIDLMSDLGRYNRMDGIRSQFSELSQSNVDLARLLDEFAGLLAEDRLRLSALVKLLIGKGVFSAEDYAGEITKLRTPPKSSE
jgi:hypothetical protein